MDIAQLSSEFMMSNVILPLHPREPDVGELIDASQRLIGLTDRLNLEDWNKGFLFSLYPFAYDFNKLEAQVLEAKNIFDVYGLDHRFDYPLFKRMEVLATQLVPCSNAYVAYCELKSQLCLEQNDFFFELYTEVENRIKSSESEAKKEFLMDLISKIRDTYDAYL